ncbi:MAG: MOSC domain-containing protein [Burkholderiales bacterium]|nr:MOSC domain-containing protein [Burkholderiales bacterium]
MSMLLKSVNVSPPTEVQYGNSLIKTGIFKAAVSGPVRVGRTNLAGDGQADLDNHGGAHKAVYAYSLDHYAYWRALLGRDEMDYGQFGENLTVAGLDESRCCVGDQLEIGSALFAISQPRVPCFKLGIRFGDETVPKLFSESARTGFYLSVLREGEIAAGDPVERVARGRGRVAIKALFEAYMRRGGKDAAGILSRALEVPELSTEWRTQIEKRLERLNK